MSEDVNPRKIGIEKTQLKDWKPELDAGEMHLLHCYNPDAFNYSNGVTFIELEHTLQLIEEMCHALKFYLEIKPFQDDGAQAFLALEKYRKFLEGIK